MKSVFKILFFHFIEMINRELLSPIPLGFCILKFRVNICLDKYYCMLWFRTTESETVWFINFNNFLLNYELSSIIIRSRVITIILSNRSSWPHNNYRPYRCNYRVNRPVINQSSYSNPHNQLYSPSNNHRLLINHSLFHR